ncbi:MAG TPA: hypothetical protein VH476_06465 [Solirubrobacterales bacterium]|jgi:hypothetical protein
MKRLTRRMPSPAMIVALISLVVAMAGTTYAALKLPKNSVGSKQLKKNSVSGAKIKKNAVTGAKVKDQSLTGKDINLTQLGTVPSAQQADSLSAPEPVHLVGAPGEPGFETGSTNLGGNEGVSTEPVGFWKDHDGVVHLQGVAKIGPSGIVGSIFSLPPGFRPAPGSLTFFNAFCAGESGKCEIDEGGDEENYGRVVVAGANISLGKGIVLNGAVVGEPGTSMSLDGITFRAKG